LYSSQRTTLPDSSDARSVSPDRAGATDGKPLCSTRGEIFRVPKQAQRHSVIRRPAKEMFVHSADAKYTARWNTQMPPQKQMYHRFSRFVKCQLNAPAAGWRGSIGLSFRRSTRRHRIDRIKPVTHASKLTGRLSVDDDVGIADGNIAAGKPRRDVQPQAC
jgi:hypothetical protein